MRPIFLEGGFEVQRVHRNPNPPVGVRMVVCQRTGVKHVNEFILLTRSHVTFYHPTGNEGAPGDDLGLPEGERSRILVLIISTTSTHFYGPCPPYAEKIDHSAGEVAKNMSRRCQSIVKKEKKTFGEIEYEAEKFSLRTGKRLYFFASKAVLSFSSQADMMFRTWGPYKGFPPPT